MTLIERLKSRAKELKSEAYALYLACKHPQTPWYAKVLAICVIAYLASPIDLIPDFIPVIGYLDDLILVPLGISLVRRLVPPRIMDECRLAAKDGVDLRNGNGRYAAVVIAIIWVALATCGGWLLWRWWGFRSRGAAGSPA